MATELAQVEDLWCSYGRYDEARAAAEEVLRRAKAQQDTQVTADALRALVRCELARARDALYKDSSYRKVILAEAERLSSEELAACRSRHDPRGEAVLQLCCAETLFESRRLPETRRGNKKRQEARALLEKALTVFQELKEPALEAETLLALSAAALAQNEPQQALQLAERAEVEPPRQRARALHACALAIQTGGVQKELFERGIKCTQQAASIWRQLRLQRPLATECLLIAKWYILLDRPRDALSPAKESLQIFKELRDGSAQEALQTLCRCLLGLADVKGALRAAQEGLEALEENSNPRIQVMALDTVVMVHLELDSMYESGNLSEAFECAQRGLSLCRQLQDKRWEASVLHNTAQIYVRQKRLDDALRTVTDSSTMLDDIGEAAHRCTVLQTAIEILMYQGDARAALEVAQEIRRLSKDLGRRGKEANAMLMEAQIYHSISNFESALRLAQEAQAVFQQLGDKKGEGMSWSVVGEIRKSQGDRDEALRACRSTQTLYQQAGDKRSQAYAMKTSTALFVANSSEMEAVKSANEALALARAAGDIKAEVEMLNLVAQATLNSIIKRSQEMRDEDAILYITEHEAKAVRPAREAAALARKMGDKQMTGIATYSVAQCHAVAGRSSASVQAATEARDLFKQTWDRQGEAMAILMLGESLVLDGDTDRGRFQAEEAHDLFKSLGDQEGMEKAEITIRQIQEISGAPAQPQPSQKRAPAAEEVSLAVVEKRMTMDQAVEMVRNVALEALGEVDQIHLDEGLMDMGLDSLGAISFRETLTRQCKINMPQTLTFDYPTLRQVADFMVNI
ncbi:unnamed protein product [Effrenium voratum]|uniref:Carrier domain-containing protein n=1 Tax=Effrenium voratum TaxID=2562239 RepID=A0AA36MS84_9DINO|nr:unnamed protein product [Effrenium voratum]